MLTPFISSFRIEFVIIFTSTIATGMSYYQASASSSRTKNNKARGCSWNRPTASGNPSGIDLDEVGGNWSHIGPLDGTSHSERTPSVNNITSGGSSFENILSNGFPMLGNPTSANQTETDNVSWQSNTHRTSNAHTHSSSSTVNNNTGRGWSWNSPTASGTPLGIDLDEVGGNRL